MCNPGKSPMVVDLSLRTVRKVEIPLETGISLFVKNVENHGYSSCGRASLTLFSPWWAEKRLFVGGEDAEKVRNRGRISPVLRGVRQPARQCAERRCAHCGHCSSLLRIMASSLVTVAHTLPPSRRRDVGVAH